MMLRVCIVCVSFGLIQTAPLAYKNPFFPNYDSVDYDEMIRQTRNLILKTEPELLLRSLETNSKSNDASVYRESDDFIKLPTAVSEDLRELDSLPKSTYFEHGIQAALPLEYDLITQNVPSPIVWNTQYPPYDVDQRNYEVNEELNSGLMANVENPYEVDLYPFVHTSISAALNSVPPVHSLPPVYATQIHDTMSSLESRGDYDIDVLNPENSELMAPNLRITRSRSDFLEDLAHDAMLNNLLPTMSVPFVRGAGRSSAYQVQQPALRTGPVMAAFPTSVTNNCAIPILLRCSPNIIRGALSSTYAEQSPPVTSGVAYREKDRINHKVLSQDKL